MTAGTPTVSQCPGEDDGDQAARWVAASASLTLDRSLHELADAGHFGHISAGADGSAVDLAELSAIVERVGGIDVGHAALLAVHHGAMQTVLLHGSSQARQRFIGPMRTARLLGSLAIIEPSVSGSNLRELVSTAIPDGSDWVISAAKSCITGAGCTGVFVTLVPFAVDGGIALTAVAIPADSPGVSVLPPERTFGLRSVPVSGIRFDGVRVAPWQILGGIGDGLEVIDQGLRIGRASAGAIGLGVMKRCAQLIYRFASQREVSTGLLITDPVVQRRTARIAAEIESIEALLGVVATEPDTPQEIFLTLKVAASEFAYHATDNAMQTLGWRGYVKRNRVAALMRDVRFLRIGEGPSEALLTELGARLAARSDTVYDWMASRGSGRDAANRLREIVDELAADTSVNNFHDLGRLGGWAILAAVAPQGSATQALIERGWRFERTKVGGRNEHASGYEQALPAYADAVGTLDEFLAGDAEVDPALHPLRRREAEPIVGPRRPGGDHSIHELVAAQIERIPQAIAIEDVHGATVTYAELGERVDAFAEHLAAAGVRPGDAIGVFLGRSVHLAVAALAIARSGVVVVVNPTHPSARVADMITDAGVSRVVVDDQTRPLVPVNAPELIAADRAGAAVASMPPPQLDPAEPAYLNFTSGSTGRPKAVTSSHRAFCNQLLWRRDEFGLGGDDALLQTAAPTFDIFMWEIFGPLVAGARLVFNPGEWDPHSIVQRVRQSSITMLQIVPSQLDVLLEEPDLGQCMTLRYVFCGGEPLSLALCRRFAAVLPHAELVNLYGPTETTIDATFWRVEVADEASWAPIGRPIANACLYVVDPEGALAAPGGEGELWIGGAGVTMGYLGSPAITAQRFRRDVRCAHPGARVYRTGDRVRQRPDGTLEFLGRMDRQLKVHGVRIEPAEIERTLCEHPGVQHAVVTVKERAPGDKALAAYLISDSPNMELDLEAVLKTCRTKLPATMVPAAVMVLDSLPRTSTGKVDMAALPAVPFAGAADADADVRDVPQRLIGLARIWEEILGRPVLDPNADFFRIGGHSLAALRVIMRVRERMGVVLQMRDFVSAGTLTGLQDLIEQKLRQVATAAEVEMLEPAPVDRRAPLPLAPMQANLWYLQQLAPTMSAYNIVEAVHIRGEVDTRRLEAAFAAVIERHEALRTIFPYQQGQPVQVVLAPGGAAPIEHADLCGGGQDDGDARAHELIAELGARPFDLQKDLPIRVLLIALGADDHYLAWSVHHIAADGWSAAGLLNAELSKAYAALGRAARLPQLSLQPIDYHHWVAGQITSGDRAALEGYWSEHLRDAPLAIDLPRDFPRPLRGSFRGARVPIVIDDDDDRAAVRALAREHGATPYSVLVVAFMAWIASRGRQRDIVIGGVTAGREHSGIENVIGNFASTLPLRCRLRDNPTFADLVVRARDEVQAMVDHSALAFPDIVNVVRAERAGTRNPIFQAVVTLFDGDIAPVRIEGAEVSHVAVDPGSAKFDLVASFADDGKTLGGFLEYDRELFKAATAERLAAELVATIGSLTRTPECRIEDYAVGGGAFVAVTPAPLTHAQLRIWLLDRRNAGGPELCAQRYFDLRGKVDVERLHDALELLAQRHPVLRTRFPERATGPVQIIGDAEPVQVRDLRGHDPSDQESLLRELVCADAARPIDITTDSPLRALILRVADDRVVLGLNYHQIVADDWAGATILAELSRLYGALGDGPLDDEPPVAPTMGQLALAESAQPRHRLEETDLPFWDEMLSGLPGRLELPTDFPAPSVASFSGARFESPLPDDVLERLDRFAAQIQVQRSTVVLAMWQYLLHHYSQQDALLVGLPFPARPAGVSEAAIGYFVNLLPVRADFSPALTLRSLTTATAERLAATTAHADVPFEELRERFAARDKAASLIEAAFVPEVPGSYRPTLDGLDVTPVPHDPGRSLFWLSLSLQSDGTALRLVFEYRDALWDAQSIARMAAHLVTLLAAGLTQPDATLAEFSMLTQGETDQLRALDGRREIRPAHPALHRWFEDRARVDPDAEAVRFLGRGLTYAQLDAESNRLARLLIAGGVRPGDKVAMLLERTPLIPIAVLAIIKTGAAYVPLDPSWPPQQAELVLCDCAPTAILTETALQHVVADHDAPILQLDALDLSDQPGTGVDIEVNDDDVAYVIYTSGSTGRPKGVEVTHANVMRLFSATEGLVEFTSADRWTMFHSIAFDFSVWELWGPLLYGGCVVMVPYLETRTPRAFRELLSRERITVLNQTPSAFRLLRDADAEAATPLYLRYVIFGGERLTSSDLIPWIEAHGDSHPDLINMYGITETTVHVTFRRLRREDVLGGRGSRIGRPIPDLECLLTDAAGNLVPLGVRGEICVAGPGLAKGYLGQPELTGQRFVPHPFRPRERLYRSGDVGRRLPSGEIDYFGRLDHQVQLHGFRIELGEVENAVSGLEEVVACHAMVRHDDAKPRLVAYVVTSTGEQLPINSSRQKLTARLPGYMLPSAIVTVESLPLTANGKIDQRALPAPMVAAGAPSATPSETTDSTRNLAASTVDQIRQVFAEVLGLPSVGADDNFFDIGGDSIYAVQLSAKARALGLAVEVQDLFQCQTPEQLAAGMIRTGSAGAALQSEPRTPMVEGPQPSDLPPGVEDAYPLAALQAGMLLHSRVDGPCIYHDVFSYLVDAPWDEIAFRAAVDVVTARHPILRTTFDLSGYSRPLQVVREEVCTPLTVIDLSGQSAAEQEATVAAWMEAESSAAMQWQTQTPFGVVIHVRDGERFELGLTVHHALLDGWSVAELQRDLLVSYDALRTTGAPPARPRLQNHFREFVMLESEAEASPSRAFWLDRLQGFQTLRFAGDRLQHVRPKFRWIELPERIEAGLVRMARSRHVPLKSTLLAAHLAVNGRLGATDDVLSGVVVNGRPETDDSASALGMFLNTVPLRIKMTAPDYAGLVDQAFAAERDLLPHRRVPLRAIQRDIGIGGLFETAFNFVSFDKAGASERTPVSAGARDSSTLRRKMIAHTNLPLVTIFAREYGALGIGIEYDPRLVSDEQFDAIVAAYLDAIEAIADGGSARLPVFRHETELNFLRPTGLVAPHVAANPQEVTRRQLERIWERVLGHPVVGTDSVRDCGGDSIDAWSSVSTSPPNSSAIRPLPNSSTVPPCSRWRRR